MREGSLVFDMPDWMFIVGFVSTLVFLLIGLVVRNGKLGIMIVLSGMMFIPLVALTDNFQTGGFNFVNKETYDNSTDTIIDTPTDITPNTLVFNQWEKIFFMFYAGVLMLLGSVIFMRRND